MEEAAAAVSRAVEKMKTKIYGTIGPACQDVDTLVRLFEKGMTGVRINLSHSNLEEAAGWLGNVRCAYEQYLALPQRNEAADSGAEQYSRPEILMDLRGPELRIGKLHLPRRLNEGDGLTLVAEGENNLFDPTELPVPKLVLPCLKPEQEVLLDDGRILLKIEEVFRYKTGYAAECVTMRGGVLNSAKSIALPGVSLHPPTLTDSDWINIRAAKGYGITGVMLPFVRNKEDLENLKEALIKCEAGDLRIFAKIENLEGVRQLPELLPCCHEVVIARGDLGNAMPLWKLPVIQEQIAEVCREREKPFMVVTQMLASMEQLAVPTRAEVSDIFRAISEGAESVMLTGETATGCYPVEAMEYLVNTVREAEKYLHYNSNRPLAPHGSTSPFEDTGSPISSAVIFP